MSIHVLGLKWLLKCVLHFAMGKPTTAVTLTAVIHVTIKTHHTLSYFLINIPGAYEPPDATSSGSYAPVNTHYAIAMVLG